MVAMALVRLSIGLLLRSPYHRAWVGLCEAPCDTSSSGLGPGAVVHLNYPPGPYASMRIAACKKKPLREGQLFILTAEASSMLLEASFVALEVTICGELVIGFAHNFRAPLNSRKARCAEILERRQHNHRLVGIDDFESVVALAIAVASTLASVDIVRRLRSCGCGHHSSGSDCEGSENGFHENVV